MTRIVSIFAACALIIVPTTTSAAAAGKPNRKTTKKGGAGRAGNSDPTCSGVNADVQGGQRRYYATTFGCDTAANSWDPEDNCHPGCASRVCTAAERADHSSHARTFVMDRTGPHHYRNGDLNCEARLKWFSTGGHQFGCGAKIRITNPTNGKSVIALVADAGPGCSIERRVHHQIVDTSHAVSCCLYGGHRGSSDHALAVVEAASAGATLGPVGGTSCLVCGGHRATPPSNKKGAKKSATKRAR